MLENFTLIDYVNDNAYFAGKPTHHYGEPDITCISRVVSDELIIRSRGIELPPQRPNTLYVVPLHMFWDLEANSDRIDYITPIRESRAGIETVYLQFRASCKKYDMVPVLDDGITAIFLIKDSYCMLSYETGMLRAAAGIDSIIGANVKFYELFLKDTAPTVTGEAK